LGSDKFNLLIQLLPDLIQQSLIQQSLIQQSLIQCISGSDPQCKYILPKFTGNLKLSFGPKFGKDFP
jgi:hypothetical protein